MSELWSSEKTSEMIRVIDEVAFQTNVFALNAAVAASAGPPPGSTPADGRMQAAWNTAALIAESLAAAHSNVEALLAGAGARQSAETAPFDALGHRLHRLLAHLRQLLTGSGFAIAPPVCSASGAPIRNAAASPVFPATPVPAFELVRRRRRT